MKRIVFAVLSALLAFGIAQAGVEQNIINIVQKQTGKKVSVLKIEALQSNPELKIAIIQDPDSKYQIPIFTSKDGNIIIGLSNVFFSNEKKDTALVNKIYEDTQSYNSQQKNSAKLNALFDTIPDDYAIFLPSTTKGVTKLTYIVSDPMCPHCQSELREIDSRLKETNVKMIPVGFLGQKSVVKSALILEKIKTAKTPAEKIQILKQIYATTYEPKEQPQKEIQKVENITKKISDSGLIKFVPYIYEYQK
ncbi:disulfide isomerase [Helicobacter sp. 12S02634-8]|uniref:DsbA family protein n=1 Tax=Helicobacter sp. 12S02634-8 TaxID=1476199 RepID=UPI000BA77108|nr:disulfide isomerase [Helicobacter sp. 12S02634-8]PAF47317.1 disulfide isomerase [Helicobacter sp. 12S02634-8]